jgi:hypothetical protein
MGKRSHLDCRATDSCDSMYMQDGKRREFIVRRAHANGGRGSGGPTGTIRPRSTGVEREGYTRQRTRGTLPDNAILTLPQVVIPKIRLLRRAKMIALKVASSRRMLSAK